MPRRNNRDKVYRCRTKNHGEPMSFLTQGRPPKDGGVTSVTKVNIQELLKVGDFFKLGEELLREFRREDAKTKIIRQNRL